MMSNKLVRNFNIVLAFIIPLFFLPITVEFYEFNKLALLTIATVGLIVNLCIGLIYRKRISFIKSPIDVPLFLFMVVAVLSAFFSISKTQSIFGASGRWFPGLWAYIVLALYFYLSNSGIQDRAQYAKSLLQSFLYGSSLSVILALLSYFSVFPQNLGILGINGFNTTGSVITTALMAAMGFIGFLSLSIREQNRVKKIVFTVLALINVIYAVMIMDIVVVVAILSGLIALVIFTNRQALVDNKYELLTVVVLTVFVIALRLVPNTRDIIVNEQYPVELRLPLVQSWQVATSTIRDYPLIATGMSTFSVNFNRYKPLVLNNGILWNVRFDKAFNEPLNVLAGMGIVGLLIMVGGSVAALKMLNKIRTDDFNTESRDTLNTASILFTVGLIALLVTYANILIAFMMIVLYSAILQVLASRSDANHFGVEVNEMGFSGSSERMQLTGITNKDYTRLFVTVPTLIVTIYLGFIVGRVYYGEFLARMGLNAAIRGQWNERYTYQRRAITVNPSQDSYHINYALTNFELARGLGAKENLTEQEQQALLELLRQSIRSANVASEVVHPLNASNWEVRAIIYSNLAGVAQDAPDFAIRAYDNAIQLDPGNPRLRVSLGGVLLSKKDYLGAANQFRQAINLKPNYANARYNFAYALEMLNDPINAKRQMEIVRQLITGEDDRKLVDEKIAALDVKVKALEEAAKRQAQEQTTVSDIVDNPNTGEQTVQEPLEVATPENQAEQVTGPNEAPQEAPDAVTEQSAENQNQ